MRRKQRERINKKNAEAAKVKADDNAVVPKRGIARMSFDVSAAANYIARDQKKLEDKL